MNNEWFKETLTPEEKGSHRKLAEDAIEKTREDQSDQTRQSLSGSYREYVDDRFPATNDGTLAEDYAQKLIIDGYDVINEINERTAEGQKSMETLQEKHKEILGEKNVAERNSKEFYEPIYKLKNQLEQLRLKVAIHSRFLLQKNDFTTEEIAQILLSEISSIEKELETAQDEKTINDLQRRYIEADEKNSAIARQLHPLDPQNN